MKKAVSILLVAATLMAHFYIVVTAPSSPGSSSYRSFGGNSGSFGGFSGGHK